MYSITPLGRKYLKDPSALTKSNAKKKAEQKADELKYYKAKAREFFRIIIDAEKLVDVIGYDYDRMSQSGQRTLEILARHLKSYQH